MKKIKIIYTSDIHGHILSSNYASKTRGPFGLSRLSTYLKSLDEPYLLLDNGDILQGSPLVDVARLHGRFNPCSLAMNLLGVSYVTLGNHDFNYGWDHLSDYISSLDATLLCANVFRGDHPIGETFVIKEVGGIQIGLVGLVTAYVPFWEKPEHIKGLTFVSAAKVASEVVRTYRSQVDVMVVLYHGGLEKDPVTQKPIGRQTIENEAMAIAAIPGVDVVLTGHQHMPTLVNQTPLVIQPAVNGLQFGEVDITLQENGLVSSTGRLVSNTFEVDEDFESAFQQLEEATQTWLDQPIGQMGQDLRVQDPLQLRSTAHPLTAFCHSLQRHISNADISIVSFPNAIPGFHARVSVRDIAATFIYPNTFVELSMSGADLLLALEQTAGYFSVKDQTLQVSDAFLYPKVEHYNYDHYDGVDYVIDVTKPVGQRITACLFQGEPLDPQQVYSVIVNNYRANGGGDYEMFQRAEVKKNIDTSMFDLAVAAIQHQWYDATPRANLTLIY
jgi:2',3'-cyclic-nucleotide 2'-phosphodiesterase / 3'-nucleotidase